MTEPLTRRRALGGIGVTLAATWTAIVGGLSAAFTLSPLRNRQPSGSVNLGSLWDFSDTFTLVRHEREVKDGWQVRKETLKLFVRVDAAGNPEAFSATCTHLGCNVNWEEASSEFLCPCHGGRYAADGTVVAGPPPASLPRLTTRVEDEELLIDLA